MNIIEAYIKFFDGIIILLSGLSGSNKTHISKFIERDFKIKLINIEKYTKKNYDKLVELNNGVKIIDWDDIDSFDWDKINEDINKYKSEGVIVCGPYFPEGTIKHNISYHVQIKVSKQNLIEKRYDYVINNQDKFNLPQGFNQQLIVNMVNQITYPHMIEYVKNSKIDKFINSVDKTDNDVSTNKTEDQIYTEIAEFLFFKINERLNNVSNNRQQSYISKSNYENKPIKNYDTGPQEIADEWEKSQGNKNNINNIKKYKFDKTISKSGSIYDIDDTTSESSNEEYCSDSSDCDDEPIYLGKVNNAINDIIYESLQNRTK